MKFTTSVCKCIYLYVYFNSTGFTLHINQDSVDVTKKLISLIRC